MAEIHERLTKAFVALNALPEAAEHAEKLASLEGTARAYLRAASIRAHARQPRQARDILSRGIALFPDSTELGQALAEFCEQKNAATV